MGVTGPRVRREERKCGEEEGSGSGAMFQGKRGD